MPQQHRNRTGMWATRAACVLTGLGIGKWALTTPHLMTSIVTLGPLGLALAWGGLLAARRGKTALNTSGSEVQGHVAGS